MLVIGHRGACGHAPENTVESALAAIALGCDVVEFDVRRTADGRLVCVHDPEIDHRLVAHYSYKELLELRPNLALLEEMLQVLAEADVSVDVELKERGHEADVLAAVHQAGFDGERLLLSSYLDECLVALREHNAAVPLALIAGSSRPATAQSLAAVPDLRCLVVKRERLSEFAPLALRRDWPCWTFTVNERSHLDDAMSVPGLEGLISDYPDRLISALNG